MQALTGCALGKSQLQTAATFMLLPGFVPKPAVNKQQKLYAEYAQAQSQRKIARTQEQCRKKLQEVGGWLPPMAALQSASRAQAALQEPLLYNCPAWLQLPA